MASDIGIISHHILPKIRLLLKTKLYTSFTLPGNEAESEKDAGMSMTDGKVTQ